MTDITKITPAHDPSLLITLTYSQEDGEVSELKIRNLLYLPRRVMDKYNKWLDNWKEEKGEEPEPWDHIHYLADYVFDKPTARKVKNLTYGEQLDIYVQWQEKSRIQLGGITRLYQQLGDGRVAQALRFDLLERGYRFEDIGTPSFNWLDVSAFLAFLPPDSAYRRVKDNKAPFKTTNGQLLATLNDYVRIIAQALLQMDTIPTPLYDNVMGAGELVEEPAAVEGEGMSPDEYRAIMRGRLEMLKNAENVKHERTK